MSMLVCTTNAGKLREFEATLGRFGKVLGLKSLSQAFGNLYVEPLEDGEAFVHNGLKKLAAAWRAFGQQSEREDLRYILVDDSGLCVPALGFKPGVHSAHYSGPVRDDARNREKLARDITAHPQARQSVLGDKRLDGFFVSCLLCLDRFRLKEQPDFEKWLFASANQQKPQFGFPGKAWEDGYFEGVMKNQTSSLSPSIPQEAMSQCLKLSYGFVWGEVSGTEQQLLEGEGHGYDALFFPKEEPMKSFASILLSQKNQWSHRGRAVEALGAQLLDGPNSSELVPG